MVKVLVYVNKIILINGEMAGKFIMITKTGKKAEISIIIPLYKGKKYCQRLLRMVRNNYEYQGFGQKCLIELIFVNDYPEEDIELEADTFRFVVKIYVHEKNKGIHAARVTGVNHANGKYIVMLDQDDLVRDNWLYSQWNKIQEQLASLCVCNGWGSRFRLLQNSDILEERINNKKDFLIKGNPIVSPGQVIIKKSDIPDEWLKHIQKVNGSDDYLLWIMMMKRGCQFYVNKEYLYLHSPRRTVDSIDGIHMAESMMESFYILLKTNFLSETEKVNFKGYIDFYGENVRKNENNKYFSDINSRTADIKRWKLYYIIRRWLDLNVRGVGLSTFFDKRKRIAIYGLGYLGVTLFYELNNSGRCVKYAIDENSDLIDFKQELEIFHWGDNFPPTDVVIITVIGDCKKIIEKLKMRLNCQIFTLDDLLSELEMDALLD